jgi:hypothetical protein
MSTPVLERSPSAPANGPTQPEGGRPPQPQQRAAEASTPQIGGLPLHAQSVEQALAALQSQSTGLDDTTAAVRLEEFGPNELVESGATPWYKLLWEQLTAMVVLMLNGAALLSLVLGKYIEAGAILAIVLLFTILGFFRSTAPSGVLLHCARWPCPTCAPCATASVRNGCPPPGSG